ncbi:uncharacterized protein N7500_003618 [Penicillium coprophilum]|uniref:uncharacterized protein n=1 Tax=Penicillium coprophilum TaxID=36646 RepID=UPI002399B13A|nr:uncharacterized protein N7500_003618 [Penicillium coprophilum]KAJ5170835.1 hypothetical protein N7500_003618 [Penicillium coprophilum]
MATLLDLPPEIILMIAEYLQIDSKQTPLLFYEHGEAYESLMARNPPSSIRNLHSFLLATKSLNSPLLLEIFYRDIFVPGSKGHGANSSLRSLNRSLEEKPSLQEHIISAIIPFEDDTDIRHFFSFTNIREITIREMYNCDWSLFKSADDSHIGTSPVECLRLINCEATEETLTDIFSRPAALKKLHYDVEQAGWECGCGECGIQPWSCAAFVRALISQKASLEELTMTRGPLVHGGLGNGPRINLSEFPNLRTLRIYHVFLCGWDDRCVWETLPPNLEVLEVYYDDLKLPHYLFWAQELPDDSYILDVIRHKKSHFPNLNTMNLHSSEGVPEPEDDREWSDGWLRVPPLLAHEADSAGVKLNVWLGSRERLVFDEEVNLYQSLKSSQSKCPMQPSNKVAAQRTYISDWILS